MDSPTAFLRTSTLVFLIALALIGPTIAVLVWLSFRFAATSGQRLTNLISGFASAVGAIVILAALPPWQLNGWADLTYGLFFIGESCIRPTSADESNPEYDCDGTPSQPQHQQLS